MSYDANGSPVSPVSNATSPADDGTHTDAFSLVEKRAYYDDEKIVTVTPAWQPNRSLSFAPEVMTLRRPSQAPEVAMATPPPVPPLPPGYTETYPAVLPSRPEPIPFWKRHFRWLAACAAMTVIMISVVIGVSLHMRATMTTSTTRAANNETESQAATVANNTLKSVASSGCFLKDGTTWNTQVFWQTANGSIHMQSSLDGTTFQAAKQVKLMFPPRIASPISATAIRDTTGTVMVSLFYISGVNDLTTATMACAPGIDKCSTVTNFVIPMLNPPSNNTGLSAVTISDVLNWRIYYHDTNGMMTELAGDNTGFGKGAAIGGSALSGTSIAAVNVNSTTNDINVFYVDQLTKALFTLRFTSGRWTRPSIVSPELVGSWNPDSGLGAAYTVTSDQLHVYYTGTDDGIYEFLGSKASRAVNTTWSGQPGRNHLWAEADYPSAAISAVGWKDQARFYQVKQGSLAEGTLSGTVWSEAFIDNTGRGSR